MGKKQKKSKGAEALFLAQQIAASGLTRKEWYNTIYLHSDHWKVLRGRALVYYGSKCDKCPATTCLQVHHLNYRNIYDVVLDDLQVLCMACHHKEHPDYGKPKEAKQPKPPKPPKVSKPKPPKSTRLARASSWSLQDVTAEIEKWKQSFRNHHCPEASAIRHVMRSCGWFIPKVLRNELRRRRMQLENMATHTHPAVLDAVSLDMAFAAGPF